MSDLGKDLSTVVGDLGKMGDKLSRMDPREQCILGEYVMGEMMKEVGKFTGDPLATSIGDALQKDARDQVLATPGILPKAKITKDFIEFSHNTDVLAKDVRHLIKHHV